MKIKKNADGSEELEGTSEELAEYEKQRAEQHEKKVTEDSEKKKKLLLEELREKLAEYFGDKKTEEHHHYHYPPYVVPDYVPPTYPWSGPVWIGDPMPGGPNTGGTFCHVFEDDGGNLKINTDGNLGIGNVEIGSPKFNTVPLSKESCESFRIKSDGSLHVTGAVDGMYMKPNTIYLGPNAKIEAGPHGGTISFKM